MAPRLQVLTRLLRTEPWRAALGIRNWRRWIVDTAARTMTDRASRSPLPSRTGAVSTGHQVRLFRRLASLGDRARDARNWFVAAAYYEEALRIDANKAAYWVQLGHALKESGDLTRAGSAYRQALSLEPDNADTHLNLGHLLKSLGRSDEASEFYARARELELAGKETAGA